MSDINIDEVLTSLTSELGKLKIATIALDTFEKSHEGDSKMNTNTTKEEQSIQHWLSIINQSELNTKKSVLIQEQYLAQAQQKMEKIIEDAKEAFEKTKEHFTSQIAQTKLSGETSLIYPRDKLKVSQENLQRKITKLKPKEQIRLEKQKEECQRRVLYLQEQQKDYNDFQAEEIRKYEARRERRR